MSACGRRFDRAVSFKSSLFRVNSRSKNCCAWSQTLLASAAQPQRDNSLDNNDGNEKIRKADFFAVIANLIGMAIRLRKS